MSLIASSISFEVHKGRCPLRVPNDPSCIGCGWHVDEPNPGVWVWSKSLTRESGFEFQFRIQVTNWVSVRRRLPNYKPHVIVNESSFLCADCYEAHMLASARLLGLIE